MALVLRAPQKALAFPGQLVVFAVIAAFLLLALMLPVATVVVVAFQERGTGGFSLVNFADFFANELFQRSFWNSIWVAAMTVAAATILAVPLAVFSARFQFRGTALIQTLGVM